MTVLACGSGRLLGALRYHLDVLIASAQCQVRTARSSALLIVGLVQPAAFMLVALLPEHGASRASVFGVAVETGLMSLWGAAIWQAGYILRNERRLATLPLMITRPCSIAVALTGKVVGAMLRLSLVVVVTVTLTSLVFGSGIRIRHVAAFALAVLASFCSTVALGMLLSSLFMLTRAADRIAEMLAYPVFIVGGFLIPVTLLPRWVRPLSQPVALSRGVELVRAALAGQPQHATTWAAFAAVSIAYAAIAALALRVVLYRARKAGSLELF